MISLFAGHEREAKRQQIGDPLALLSRHIDFAGIAHAGPWVLASALAVRLGRRR
ncbi:hypothetical protein [uncultured Xanthomonas sp.]|uniref:hypothetical protein n=1 Tax=uncultured Xanthomonas sp. TaxID=152831 RepID=UPI0025EFF35A|nr:hypothetical protein [uncultured Xanthomonas sp.]